MNISPTLGITPINTAPISQFGAAASAQLQQFGAQLRDDITTIQGNEQLKNMAQQLQGVDPTDLSGNFPSQMTQAIASNPLGAHTPAGISILSTLGNAHQGAIQQAIWGQRIAGNLAVTGMKTDASQANANTNANAKETAAGINKGEINFAPNPGDPSAPPSLQVNPNQGQGKWAVRDGTLYNDTTGENYSVSKLGDWVPQVNSDGSVKQMRNKTTGEFQPIENFGGTPSGPKPITLGSGAEALQGGTVIGSNPKADSTQTRSNPAGAKLIDQHQKDVDSASDALADAATTFGIEDAKKQKYDAGKWRSGYDPDQWTSAKVTLDRAQRNAATAQQIFARDQEYLKSPSSPLSSVPAIGNSFSGVSSVAPTDDQKAIAWARANPNDPRAAGILRLHGLQ